MCYIGATEGSDLAYLVPLTLQVRQRDDGSFVATSKELPVLVAARDIQTLKAKLRAVQESIDTYLHNMSEDEALAFLRERGIEPDLALDMAAGFSMPVLVGG